MKEFETQYQATVECVRDLMCSKQNTALMKKLQNAQNPDKRICMHSCAKCGVINPNECASCQLSVEACLCPSPDLCGVTRHHHCYCRACLENPCLRDPAVNNMVEPLRLLPRYLLLLRHGLVDASKQNHKKVVHNLAKIHKTLDAIKTDKGRASKFPVNAAVKMLVFGIKHREYSVLEDRMNSSFAQTVALAQVNIDMVHNVFLQLGFREGVPRVISPTRLTNSKRRGPKTKRKKPEPQPFGPPHAPKQLDLAKTLGLVTEFLLSDVSTDTFLEFIQTVHAIDPVLALACLTMFLGVLKRFEKSKHFWVPASTWTPMFHYTKVTNKLIAKLDAMMIYFICLLFVPSHSTARLSIFFNGPMFRFMTHSSIMKRKQSSKNFMTVTPRRTTYDIDDTYGSFLTALGDLKTLFWSDLPLLHITSVLHLSEYMKYAKLATNIYMRRFAMREMPKQPLFTTPIVRSYVVLVQTYRSLFEGAMKDRCADLLGVSRHRLRSMFEGWKVYVRKGPGHQVIGNLLWCGQFGVNDDALDFFRNLVEKQTERRKEIGDQISDQPVQSQRAISRKFSIYLDVLDGNRPLRVRPNKRKPVSSSSNPPKTPTIQNEPKHQPGLVSRNELLKARRKEEEESEDEMDDADYDEIMAMCDEASGSDVGSEEEEEGEEEEKEPTQPQSTQLEDFYMNQNMADEEEEGGEEEEEDFYMNQKMADEEEDGDDEEEEE